MRYFLCLIFLLFSCSYKYKHLLLDEYGVKWNNERQKVGLMPISDKFDCVDFGVKRGGGYFASYILKSVKFNDSCVFYSVYDLERGDTLLFEIQKIYGRKLVNTLDGTFREEMQLTYFFCNCVFDEKFHKRGWECTLKNALENEDDIVISRENADSIISSWNIKIF